MSHEWWIESKSSEWSVGTDSKPSNSMLSNKEHKKANPKSTLMVALASEQDSIYMLIIAVSRWGCVARWSELLKVTQCHILPLMFAHIDQMFTNKLSNLVLNAFGIWEF